MADAEARLLEVCGLAAGYGGGAVIAGIDFAVRRGGFTAILGGNGSGKSTLLRAISGQIPIVAGSVRIAGADIATTPERAKRALGYAVDPGDLPGDLTGMQYLEMIGSIRGCDADAWPCGDLTAILRVGRWLPEMIETCSLGTRMKLSIMGALLGAPPLLLLDEVLNGLDPLILGRMRRLLCDLCAAGHGVVMATHMLGAIDAGCSDVLMMEVGGISHRWDAPMIAAARRNGGFETMVMATLEAAAK